MDAPAGSPVSARTETIIKGATSTLAVTLALALTGAASAQTIKQYAQQQAAKAPYRWTGPEWTALDAIVTPESRWNPCARYPSRSECGYAGSNSCGIPQRNPCPAAWRGRLASSWREQVAELLRYVKARYGSPSAALGYRRRHNSY